MTVRIAYVTRLWFPTGSMAPYNARKDSLLDRSYNINKTVFTDA